MRCRAFFPALLGLVALSGCSEGVLDPKGPIAEAERQILFNSLGIMLAIRDPTIVAILGVAFCSVHPTRALAIGPTSAIPAGSR